MRETIPTSSQCLLKVQRPQERVPLLHQLHQFIDHGLLLQTLHLCLLRVCWRGSGMGNGREGSQEVEE